MKLFKQFILENTEVLSSLEYHTTSKKQLEYSFSVSTEKLTPMSYTVAKEPTEVETILPDGKETKNKAEPGDIIMSGPSGERYVIKAKKFGSLYSGKIGEKIKVAPNPRQVARYSGKDTISFKAPWGEDMVLKPGDYVVKDGDSGFYRIAKAEFEKTYETIPDESKNTKKSNDTSENPEEKRPMKEPIAGRDTTFDPGKTWKTSSGLFGAKNREGIIRYFEDADKAQDWARSR